MMETFKPQWNRHGGPIPSTSASPARAHLEFCNTIAVGVIADPDPPSAAPTTLAATNPGVAVALGTGAGALKAPDAGVELMTAPGIVLLPGVVAATDATAWFATGEGVMTADVVAVLSTAGGGGGTGAGGAIMAGLTDGGG